MISNDPDFEAKAADVIGLYLIPPAHAAVFCVDEKTVMPALERKGMRQIRCTAETDTSLSSAASL